MPIGSMVLPYMVTLCNIYHQHTPNVSIYINIYTSTMDPMGWWLTWLHLIHMLETPFDIYFKGTLLFSGISWITRSWRDQGFIRINETFTLYSGCEPILPGGYPVHNWMILDATPSYDRSNQNHLLKKHILHWHIFTQRKTTNHVDKWWSIMTTTAPPGRLDGVFIRAWPGFPSWRETQESQQRTWWLSRCRGSCHGWWNDVSLDWLKGTS